MVLVSEQSNSVQIVLMPNRSMSWESNKKILIALFLVNVGIALAWASMGAWMILPFAGLEVILVGVAMYYVSWKLNSKQILSINKESIVLQKGVYFPKQEWRWQRSDTRLIQIPSRYRMSPPSMWLRHANDQVEIGEFLNLDEKKELRKQIKNLNLAIMIRPRSTR